MDYYSRSQYVAINCIIMASSLLSIAGSMVIVVATTRRLQQRQQQRTSGGTTSTGGTTNSTAMSSSSRNRGGCSSPTMQLLLRLLAIMDILSSIGWFGGELGVPKTHDRPWTMGSLASCTIFGAVHVFGTTGGSLSNLALSLYFWKMTRRLSVFRERFWIGLILGWPLGLVLYGLVTNNFGIISNGGCWAGGDYPVGCDNVDVMCLRGGPELQYYSSVIVLSIVICVLASFAATMMVLKSYRQMITKSRRYSFSGALPTANDLLLKQVTAQSIYFFLAYFNIFFGFIISYIIGITGKFDNLFPLFVVGHILIPLQGFFNCLVYMRPSYRRWKEYNPDLTVWQALMLSIQAKTPGSEYEPDPTGDAGALDISKQGQQGSVSNSSKPVRNSRFDSIAGSSVGNSLIVNPGGSDEFPSRVVMAGSTSSGNAGCADSSDEIFSKKSADVSKKSADCTIKEEEELEEEQTAPMEEMDESIRERKSEPEEKHEIYSVTEENLNVMAMPQAVDSESKTVSTTANANSLVAPMPPENPKIIDAEFDFASDMDQDDSSHGDESSSALSISFHLNEVTSAPYLSPMAQEKNEITIYDPDLPEESPTNSRSKVRLDWLNRSFQSFRGMAGGSTRTWDGSARQASYFTKEEESAMRRESRKQLEQEYGKAFQSGFF